MHPTCERWSRSPLGFERSRLRECRNFDPCDGGVTAECLFLLEAPGAKAVGSGFISRNNPDETASNFFAVNAEAGIPRSRTVTWNAVPWYIGSGTRIRAATGRDLRDAERFLGELISLLPHLKVIVLVGQKAQRLRTSVQQLAPSVPVLSCPHPSPLSFNGRPERRIEMLTCLAQVKSVARFAGAHQMSQRFAPTNGMTPTTNGPYVLVSEVDKRQRTTSPEPASKTTDNRGRRDCPTVKVMY
jgi:uracil-DNA glycosylase